MLAEILHGGDMTKKLAATWHDNYKVGDSLQFMQPFPTHADTFYKMNFSFTAPDFSFDHDPTFNQCY